jgi:hypothetical protein
MVSAASMTKAVANDAVQRWRSFTRTLIAVAIAYALVLQVFVAALGPLLATDGGPGLANELCAHAAQGAPVAPSDLPDKPCVQHCILCLASSSVALATPQASTIQAVEPPISQVLWHADRPSLPQPSRYALARPRGPPFNA